MARGRHLSKQDALKTRNARKLGMRVGDRITHLPRGKSTTVRSHGGYYTAYWVEIPGTSGALILETKSPYTVRLHGDKSFVDIDDHWVVTQTKEERAAAKKATYDKEYQRNRVRRCITEVEKYISKKQHQVDRWLEQIPIDKRFTFLGAMSEREKKIFQLLYEDFSPQKDKK